MGKSLAEKILTTCKDCEDNQYCTNDMCPCFWFDNRKIIRDGFRKWSVPNENNKTMVIAINKRQNNNVV